MLMSGGSMLVMMFGFEELGLVETEDRGWITGDWATGGQVQSALIAWHL